jgi:hypothetical protein
MNTQIKLSFLLFFLFAFVFNANSQVMHAAGSLKFCNDTPTAIDSIVMQGTSNATILYLQPDSSKTFDIPEAWMNTHGTVLCNYKVYFKQKFYTGQIIKGISRNTIKIERDDNIKAGFCIYVHNMSSYPSPIIKSLQTDIENIDSITPRVKVIRLNAHAFSKNPTMEVIVNGKRFAISLDSHDFNNLSDSSAAIWISDSAVLPGKPPIQYQLEYTVVLRAATENTDLSSIKIKARGITAKYNLPSEETQVLIFNFLTLKAHRKIIVHIEGKGHKLTFSDIDFSEAKDARKYFLVSNKYVRAEY